jgi:hypothetical protein
MKLLLSLNQTDGTTLLIVTHDPEVAAVAERSHSPADGLIEKEEVRVNFFLNIKEAMVSLSANKMRSLLTILGIVIGVASVIALLVIGRERWRLHRWRNREHRHQCDLHPQGKQ